jgi:dipeptidyl aminopeptidase/acylaminoacyl peptidase
MYERHFAFSFYEPHEWRDMVIHWSKDLGRTLDYLETREDVDRERLAFYGFSGGGQYGLIYTAIDGRFKASVLLAGGLDVERKLLPEIEVLHFAPRSHVPTLMLNGRDDFMTPLEISQPLFRLIGVPDSDKRQALLEGGHVPRDRLGIIKEVLDWLDRYLGPVKTQ